MKLKRLRETAKRTGKSLRYDFRLRRYKPRKYWPDPCWVRTEVGNKSCRNKKAFLHLMGEIYDQSSWRPRAET